MSTPIVTGILSYGMSGRVFHAPFVDTHPSFSFYAVTERSTKKAAGRYPGIISYDTVDELINDPKVELIIVNTPNNTHYEYARQALEAGKHVLVEKPFAASSAEAKELFDLGRKNNCRVMAYQNRRWDADFLSVRSVIESGRLGTLIEVHFRFDRYRPGISQKEFKELPLPASGLTYDLGPHLIDQVISLFGIPLKVQKTSGVFRDRSQVDDYVHFHLVYPGNLNVFVTSSLLVASPLPAFVIHGSDGSYIKDRTDVQEEQLDKGVSPADPAYGEEPDGTEGILTIFDEDGDRHTEYIASVRGNYNHLFDAVYQHIRLSDPFPVTEEDILTQMEILERTE